MSKYLSGAAGILSCSYREPQHVVSIWGATQGWCSLSTSDSTTLAPTRVCSKCGTEYPATREFFDGASDNVTGLRRECKKCRAARRRAQHAKKPSDYYARNREKILEWRRVYREAHREQYAAYARAAYWRDPEAGRAKNRAFQAEHPEVFAAKARNRYAREKKNGGTHTVEDVQAQYERQKGKCFYCGKKVGKKYDVDHVVPIAKGGSNGPENLVIACPSCNRKKRDKDIQVFCGRLL